MSGFKSEAHKRKAQELVKLGKITMEKYLQWEKETPKNTKLPERLHPKKEVVKTIDNTVGRKRRK